MLRITHPHPLAGRQSALGVDFIDGVAEVEELHPEREQALLQHGYSIGEVAAERPSKASKGSGKGKPVKAAKGSESKAGALSEPPVTVADMEAVAELGRSLPQAVVSAAWNGDVPEITSEA